MERVYLQSIIFLNEIHGCRVKEELCIDHGAVERQSLNHCGAEIFLLEFGEGWQMLVERIDHIQRLEFSFQTNEFHVVAG